MFKFKKPHSTYYVMNSDSTTTRAAFLWEGETGFLALGWLHYGAQEEQIMHVEF
jgi:hypothetical protein